jgi:hypothetical protein
MIGLKWKKKEWKQFGRQKMLEEQTIKFGFDMLGKTVGKFFEVMATKAAEKAWEPRAGGARTGIQCQTTQGPVSFYDGANASYSCDGNTAYCSGKDCKFGTSRNCSAGCFPIAASNSKKPENENEHDDGLSSIDGPGDESGMSLTKICEVLNGSEFAKEADAATVRNTLLTGAKAIVDVNSSLFDGGPGARSCGSTVAKTYEKDSNADIKTDIRGIKDSMRDDVKVPLGQGRLVVTDTAGAVKGDFEKKVQATIAEMDKAEQDKRKELETANPKPTEQQVKEAVAKARHEAMKTAWAKDPLKADLSKLGDAVAFNDVALHIEGAIEKHQKIMAAVKEGGTLDLRLKEATPATKFTAASDELKKFKASGTRDLAAAISKDLKTWQTKSAGSITGMRARALKHGGPGEQDYSEKQDHTIGRAKLAFAYMGGDIDQVRLAVGQDKSDPDTLATHKDKYKESGKPEYHKTDQNNDWVMKFDAEVTASEKATDIEWFDGKAADGGDQGGDQGDASKKPSTTRVSGLVTAVDPAAAGGVVGGHTKATKGTIDNIDSTTGGPRPGSS